MAKQAKKTQTDYTIGGKAISDTAIPLYQSGLTQLSDWTLNPQQQADELMNKYFSGNVQQSDLLRNYQRAMGNVTANNYAATHGGYSSSGDMARMDQQRNWNDLVARTQGQNVANAFNIANANVANLQNSINAYDQAYGRGKEYSDIQQWNYLADQANSWTNQLGGAMGTIGTAVGSIWGPVGAMVGNAIGSGIGGQMSTDTDRAFNSIGGVQTKGSGDTGGQYGGNQWNNLTDAINKLVSRAKIAPQSINTSNQPTYYTNGDGVVLRR